MHTLPEAPAEAYLWSDSKVVLAWIQSPSTPQRKTFIANRVAAHCRSENLNRCRKLADTLTSFSRNPGSAWQRALVCQTNCSDTNGEDFTETKEMKSSTILLRLLFYNIYG